MRFLIAVLLLSAGGAEPATGQERPFLRDSARATRLRAEVERRFSERVQHELDLTDEQTAKLRETQERFGPRRRALWDRQRTIRRALESQMRPGVAAEPDSVKQLLDELRAGRAELLSLDAEEDRDMAGYLSPVQRAQFQLLRERFLRRVQELRRDGPGDRRRRSQRAPTLPR